MRRWMLSVIAAAAIVFVVTSPRSASAQSPQAAVPWGMWAWQTEMAPGMSLPALLTIHADGTVNVSDGAMFGGLPGAQTRMSPLHGTWIFTGHHAIGGTSLFFVFDAASGVLIAIGRSRTSLEFGTDFDHLQGRMFIDLLPCASPLACPDPTDANAAWMPYPGMPSDGFAVSASRLHRVPAGPLGPGGLRP